MGPICLQIASLPGLERTSIQTAWLAESGDSDPQQSVRRSTHRRTTPTIMSGNQLRRPTLRQNESCSPRPWETNSNAAIALDDGVDNQTRSSRLTAKSDRRAHRNPNCSFRRASTHTHTLRHAAREGLGVCSTSETRQRKTLTHVWAPAPPAPNRANHQPTRSIKPCVAIQKLPPP